MTHFLSISDPNTLHQMMEDIDINYSDDDFEGTGYVMMTIVFDKNDSTTFITCNSYCYYVCCFYSKLQLLLLLLHFK